MQSNRTHDKQLTGFYLESNKLITPVQWAICRVRSTADRLVRLSFIQEAIVLLQSWWKHCSRYVVWFLHAMLLRRTETQTTCQRSRTGELRQAGLLMWLLGRIDLTILTTKTTTTSKIPLKKNIAIYSLAKIQTSAMLKKPEVSNFLTRPSLLLRNVYLTSSSLSYFCPYFIVAK